MRVALAKPDALKQEGTERKTERYKSYHSINVYILLEMYVFFVSGEYGVIRHKLTDCPYPETQFMTFWWRR